MAILIVLILIAGVGYYISLRIHPLTKCKVCNGTGRHFGSVYTSAHRRCRKCGGSGRQDRLGVRLFLGGTGDTGIFSKR
jgi:DnaJ-class molecular chaperone